MNTSDKNTDSGPAAARPFRSGIARTLGRRALPSRTQPQSVAELAAPDGGIATPRIRDPAQRQSDLGLSAAHPSPRAVVGDARREAEPTFRSQSQMAAIFARAVARGQRNL